MSGRIVINFAPQEGAVLRILGLVERRGFHLRGLSMAEEASAASMTLDVEPRDSARRLDVVARQLQRLIDVRSVAFSNPDAGAVA